ncbi:hypothetical protein Xph01_59280 [Micromonospora phaseoli]|nr:hypothetical protein Xph01_59280 [Micromonospora phaseoli]
MADLRCPCGVGSEGSVPRSIGVRQRGKRSPERGTGTTTRQVLATPPGCRLPMPDVPVAG